VTVIDSIQGRHNSGRAGGAVNVLTQSCKKQNGCY